jgi:diguanylate cyclase (GGDEF)-like protein
MGSGAHDRDGPVFEHRLDRAALGLYLLGVAAPALALGIVAVHPEAVKPQVLAALVSGVTLWCLGAFVALRHLMHRWRERMDRRTGELAQALEEKDALAYQDGLTGLPNRRLYLDRLQQALISAQRRGQSLAVCFLDLDGFKRINATLGHSYGDRVLQEVARRLLASIRASDSVARLPAERPDAELSRLGGDEFTFLLMEIAEPRNAANVAWRVLETLRKPFELEGYEVFATASIGIAVYPTDGEDAEALVRHADVAMYHAKSCGRNNYQFYDPSMNAVSERRLHLEGCLRRALDREEFSLVYQPIRDAVTGRICAGEALLRWESAKAQTVSPLEFIPIAEETGLIVELGEWVLRTACTQCEAWRRAGLQPIRMGVNVSGRQLRQPSFVARVARVLNETGLSPGQLDLEITESTIMQEDDVTNAAFYALEEMGVGIALDDFGTGYSSLSYLRRFAIDRVKIDRSFIREISANADDAALTTAIISMAHSLHRRVVAEGVETLEQADFLRENGCDELQGYLFSKPIREEEFTRLLELEKEA